MGRQEVGRDQPKLTFRGRSFGADDREIESVYSSTFSEGAGPLRAKARKISITQQRIVDLRVASFECNVGCLWVIRTDSTMRQLLVPVRLKVWQVPQGEVSLNVLASDLTGSIRSF